MAESDRSCRVRAKARHPVAAWARRRETTLGGYRVAAAKLEGLAIPTGTHAVEFFADPVARNIDIAAIALGQKQGRGCRLGGQRQGGRCYGKQREQ